MQCVKRQDGGKSTIWSQAISAARRDKWLS